MLSRKASDTARHTQARESQRLTILQTSTKHHYMQQCLANVKKCSTPALFVCVLVESGSQCISLLSHLLHTAFPYVAFGRAVAHDLHTPCAVHLLANALQAGQHILQLPCLARCLAIKLVYLHSSTKSMIIAVASVILQR